MGYSMDYVIKQLKYNRKIYIAFILEIAVGVTLFVSCINIYFSWTDQLEELKRDRVGKEVTVSYYSVDSSENKDSANSPITYKDYQTLSEKYKDSLVLSYGSESHVPFALKSTQKFFQFENFFMDNKMYETLFGSKMKSETAYVGVKAYENIKEIAEKLNTQGEVILFQDYFIINQDGSITLKGVGNFNVKPIENKKNVKIIRHPEEKAAAEEDNFNVEDCVILPLKNIKNIENQLYGWKILKVKYRASESEINQIPALLADLAKWHGSDYIYSVPDEFLNMESTIEDADNLILRYFYASICILIIITVGMIGVMLLFLHQRKQPYAIKIAYGSTWKRIFAELFIELWIVFLTGGGIGLGVSYILLPMLKGAVAGNITFHLVCIPLLFGIMTIAAFIVCICSIAGMDKIPPAQILKEL